MPGDSNVEPFWAVLWVFLLGGHNVLPQKELHQSLRVALLFSGWDLLQGP